MNTPKEPSAQISKEMDHILNSRPRLRLTLVDCAGFMQSILEELKSKDAAIAELEKKRGEALAEIVALRVELARCYAAENKQAAIDAALEE